jgi:hypothetical protein
MSNGGVAFPPLTALLRKIALDLLKADKTVKDTVRGKRLQATFSETILSQFLRIDYSK